MHVGLSKPVRVGGLALNKFKVGFRVGGLTLNSRVGFRV